MASPPFATPDIEPRVVICDRGDQSSVEVLDLANPVEIGTEFEREGKQWRIVAQRPRSRVLLAYLLNGPSLA